jgi:archaemetzincin
MSDLYPFKKDRIGVVAVGNVSVTPLKVITAHISGYLDLPAELLPPLAHPSYALDTQRRQYNAAVVIRKLESISFHQHDKIVAVVEVDLFVPIFTHVFGEARQGGNTALVSMYRLGKTGKDHLPASSMALERAAKIALHELGHLYDLSHCMDSNCLMHFAGDLEDLDRTPLYLCRYCTAFFRDAVKRTVS